MKVVESLGCLEITADRVSCDVFLMEFYIFKDHIIMIEGSSKHVVLKSVDPVYKFYKVKEWAEEQGLEYQWREDQ